MILKNKISLLTIENLEIKVTQKRMKNMRVVIHPPLAEIRVSAPLRLSLKRIKAFVISKLDWIKKQKLVVENQKRESPKKFIQGELHDFFGEKYSLKIFENSATNSVKLVEENIQIRSKKSHARNGLELMLDKFYREQLTKIIPKFIADFEKKMHVKVDEFRIKKMKTRWGTCNPMARRIWINLELAKKPAQCLEYIVLHEMVHLLERHHNKKFFAHMDHFMPAWRDHRNKLKS